MYTLPAGAFGTWSATPRCLFLPTVNVQLSGRARRAVYWSRVARISTSVRSNVDDQSLLSLVLFFFTELGACFNHL